MMASPGLGGLVLGFVLAVSVVGSERHCPEFCLCDTWYELERATCTGRHLYSVHTGLRDTVEALDLSNNSVSSLNSFELANIGLWRLKYLNLSGNSISEIGLDAFIGLDHLMVLDLSRNHLRFILDNVVEENRELRILKLSGNNFDSHVPKLRSYWLMTLDLDSCKIGHLPADTFNELRNLRSLDLSNNLMIQIDSVAFRSIHSLRTLSLQGNPWSCNQPMLDLQSQLRHRGVTFASFCVEPGGPNKSEKMILLPAVDRDKAVNQDSRRHQVQHPSRKSKKVQPGPRFSKIVPTSPEPDGNQCRPGQSTSRNAEPYIFLAAGFVLGAAFSTFVSYFCLTRRCCPAGSSQHDPQRLSLLSSILEDLQPEERTVSCPGTPPPPYREVMLRPGLYRNTSGYAGTVHRFGSS